MLLYIIFLIIMKKRLNMKIVKCISNESYKASLTVGKNYIVVEDNIAQQRSRIRVIDNTNESYLYPIYFFDLNVKENKA